MSTRQLIENLISNAPENKLDVILAFVKFILHEPPEISDSILSEPSLSKDWLSEEEDDAWKNL